MNLVATAVVKVGQVTDQDVGLFECLSCECDFRWPTSP